MGASWVYYREDRPWWWYIKSLVLFCIGRRHLLLHMIAELMMPNSTLVVSVVFILTQEMGNVT